MNAEHGQALRFDGVSKSYGSTLALKDISLTIPTGKRIGLVGPNGAGKTTLLSILAGLTPSYNGTVHGLPKGVSPTTTIAYAPQDPTFPHRTGVLRLALFYAQLAGFTGSHAKQEAQRVLEAVDLWEHRTKASRALSHGMLKRLSVAQALIGSAPLVLLDEPTAGLDPENARRLRNIVIAKSPAQTLILSSHNLAEIEECCDHLILLSEGSLVSCESMESFRGTGETINLLLEAPPEKALLKALRALDGVQKVECPDGKTRVTIEVSATAIEEVMAKALMACNTHKASVQSLQRGQALEARFLDATQGSSGDSGSS